MEQEEITLKELIQIVREYWQYLLAKWKIIISVAIIGAIIGLFVSILTKPKYEASLKFVVDDNSGQGGGLMALASSFGLGGGGSDQSLFSSSNIIEFLKTRTMLEEALLRPVQEKTYEKKTYAELYIEKNKLNEDWSEDSVLKDIRFNVGDDRTTFSRAKDSILGRLCTKIIEKELFITKVDKENSFIEIKAITRNEVFSKNFTEELMSVASEYYIESRTQKNKISVDVLQRQTDSVKNNLFRSMGGAASTSDQVFGLNPAMSVQRVSSVKEQASVQMNIAILQELVKNLELAKVSLLNNTPVITIVEKPVYPLEVKKIGKVKGFLIGGLLAGFAVIVFLLGKKYWRGLINEN